MEAFYTLKNKRVRPKTIKVKTNKKEFLDRIRIIGTIRIVQKDYRIYLNMGYLHFADVF